MAKESGTPAPERARRVGLVTCRVLPEPDPDQEPLLAALRERGLVPELLAWDANPADGSMRDLCVFRSCWNSHERPGEFLAWLDGAARRCRFLNPPDVVRWNFHKRYLLELSSAGVPVVPTRLFSRGATPAAIPDAPGWDDVVVKPAISAASFRTRRFPAGARAEAGAFLETLLGERDALVQPYVAGVEREGERAIVWIDGAVTHAVRKSPRFAGAEESVSGSLPATEEERGIAERAIAAVRRRLGGPLLYARVDLMPDAAGRPLVSELELIEPSLFLAQEPAALLRLVDAIEREVAGP